jgi:hemoglobin-like flavoprotein
MTPLQIQHVQHSFAVVAPIAEAVAETFYARLFDLDPALKPLFKGDMSEQGRKLMQVIATAVNGLDRLDAIVPAVQALGVRHAGYGVTERSYDTVGNALLWTLEQGLGENFTPEVRESWIAAYAVIADTMKAAARTVSVAPSATVESG